MQTKALAIEAVKTAGRILKKQFYTQSLVEAKGKHDIVTDADRESESAILQILQNDYPDYNYIAEESGTQMNSSKCSWYIDPLDGTTNFVTGNPYFSVSIALAYQNEVILGVIFNPITNELYFAEKGKGAYLNNERIKVSKNSDLSRALIASAYSAEEKAIKKGLKTIEKLALSSRKVLVNFSPALDLCNIARGRLDGLVDNGTTPEDHAAGSLIVKEAGGCVQNFDDEDWSVNKIGIIASNEKLQKSIKGILLFNK